MVAKKRWKPTTKKRGSGKLRDRGVKIRNVRQPHEYDIGVHPTDDIQVAISSWVVPYGPYKGTPLLELDTRQLNDAVVQFSMRRHYNFADCVRREIERRQKNLCIIRRGGQ